MHSCPIYNKDNTLLEQEKDGLFNTWYWVYWAQIYENKCLSTPSSPSNSTPGHTMNRKTN